MLKGKYFMQRKFYKEKPIKVIDSIPFFSERDDYIANYQLIAENHLSAMNKGILNPFIEDAIWADMEKSTSDLILKYIKPGFKILDVGVGTGRLLENFNFVEKFGMDISLDYLNISKNKGIEVCFAKVEDMPYQDNYFDMIVCTDVLEHVIDVNLALCKIIRVLKSGGLLFTRVPYKEDLEKYISISYPYRYSHLRNFDENSLFLLFNRAFNLKVLETSFSSVYPYIERLKYPLFLPKRLQFLLILTVKIMKIHSRQLYNLVLNRLFVPIEINFVVMKE